MVIAWLVKLEPRNHCSNLIPKVYKDVIPVSYMEKSLEICVQLTQCCMLYCLMYYCKCNVNILVCASTNLKVLPPGIMGDCFQWGKSMRFLITLRNFPVIHWLSRCVIFSSQVWIWCSSLHWLGCCFSLASGRWPTLLLLPPENILPNTTALSQACSFQWERLCVTQKQSETTLEQTENGHWNTRL